MATGCVNHYGCVQSVYKAAFSACSRSAFIEHRGNGTMTTCVQDDGRVPDPCTRSNETPV
eukprot:1161261-Pelagomonas_calceolata.AAC.2